MSGARRGHAPLFPSQNRGARTPEKWGSCPTPSGHAPRACPGVSLTKTSPCPSVPRSCPTFPLVVPRSPLYGIERGHGARPKTITETTP